MGQFLIFPKTQPCLSSLNSVLLKRQGGKNGPQKAKERTPAQNNLLPNPSAAFSEHLLCRAPQKSFILNQKDWMRDKVPKWAATV